MQEEKTIRAEIEALREKLNEKMVSSNRRMPDSEMLELSRKMDELLNNLNKVTVK